MQKNIEMIFLFLAASGCLCDVSAVLRYVFPMWEMNIYDSGVVTAKNNVTVLQDRLNFYSLMQQINLGHTIASSVGTLGMAAVACVAAPIPGTIGAVSFGLYAAYHALLKGLSSAEISQAQFRIKELRGEAKLTGKYVAAIYSHIPEFFYRSDLLGWALVVSVAWAVWAAKIHQIREWAELRRVIGMLAIGGIALVSIGFLQTIHNVETQEIGRREWLATEIDHKCNVLQMNFIERIRHEAKSFFGATIDSDGYVHNAVCNKLVDEYRLIRGDLLSIAVKCLVRVVRGSVMEELFGGMGWTSKLLMLGILVVGAGGVLLKTLANQQGGGVWGPALRVAAIGLIVLAFMRILSII